MDLPPLLSRTVLRAEGYSDVELRRSLRAGDLSAVRPGTYLRGAAPDDAHLRHAVAARAALDRMAGGVVCSHVTAALLHGLRVWRIPLDRVHVTRTPRGSGSRSNARVHVHAAPLGADEVCVVAGIPVTSLARTVVDIARTVPFEDAVVVADAAMFIDDDRSGWTAPPCRLRWPEPIAGAALPRPDGRWRSPSPAAGAWANPAAEWPSAGPDYQPRSCSGRSGIRTGC